MAMRLDERGFPDYGEEGPLGPYVEVLSKDWLAMVARVEELESVLMCLVEAWDDYRENESQRGQDAITEARRLLGLDL